MSKVNWDGMLHTGVGMGMGIGAGAARATMAAVRAIVIDSFMVNVCCKLVRRGSVAAPKVSSYFLEYMMRCDGYLAR